MSSHKLLIPLLGLVSVIVGGVTGPSLLLAGSDPAPPHITVTGNPTPGEQAMVDWAVGRYAEAGLRLPDLEIRFTVECGGLAGRHHVGERRIDICRPSKRLVLHELAHAWDDTGAVDRNGFLRLRGLDHWYERADRNKHDTGGEQVAHIVAWGLMDVETTTRAPVHATQPLDEQPRALPGVDHSSPAELELAFVWLTGRSALHRSG